MLAAGVPFSPFASFFHVRLYGKGRTDRVSLDFPAERLSPQYFHRSVFPFSPVKMFSMRVTHDDYGPVEGEVPPHIDEGTQCGPVLQAGSGNKVVKHRADEEDGC